MSIKYVCTLTLLALHVSSMPLKQAKVVKALNCGLKEGSTKSDDIKYESVLISIIQGRRARHRQFGRRRLPLRSQRTGRRHEVKLCKFRYAMDKEIYMYERHTYSEMTYALPVKTGVHTVILKFAEVCPVHIPDVLPKAWPTSIQYQDRGSDCCAGYGPHRQVGLQVRSP